MDFMKLFYLLLISTNFIYAFSTANNVKQAELAYNNKNFEKAEYLYSKMFDKHKSFIYAHNAGDSAYKLTKFDSARDYFLQSINLDNNKKLEEKNYYNLGNSYFKLKEYQKAIDAYEHVLSVNSKNNRAEHNLQEAKKMLEQQSKQQKPDDSPDQSDENAQKKETQRKEQPQKDKRDNSKDSAESNDTQNNSEKKHDNNKAPDEKDSQDSSHNRSDSEKNKLEIEESALLDLINKSDTQTANTLLKDQVKNSAENSKKYDYKNW